MAAPAAFAAPQHKCQGAGHPGSLAAAPAVHWQMKPDGTWKKGVISFTVNNTDSIEWLLFNQHDREHWAVSAADSVVQLNAGYYAVKSPRFGAGCDPVTVDIACSPGVVGIAEGPEAFHALTPSGRIIPVASTFTPVLDQVLANDYWRNWMQAADSVYAQNERRANGNAPGHYDVVPAFKKIDVKQGAYRHNGTPKITTKQIRHKNPEYYRIKIGKEGISIEGASPEAVAMARRVLERQMLPASRESLPFAVIEDWPDFPYRGVMLDISRNYQQPEEVRKIVDLMADYRMNRLQFHIIDDEGWRLEIPGLPELTQVGSRRGYTTDDSEFLAQTYSGDTDPDSPFNIGNGHFSRDEFIRFLQYCDSLGIVVVTEIESPGHARAAIKSMEARYRNTGDDTYRLIIPGDTSIYTTAQGYSDALMNPAAPGTYRFLEKVTDEVRKMYAEAGAPFPGIHFGGDEVPDGAWDGCAETARWASEAGIENNRHAIHGEFVRRLASIMREKGVQIYGWQDIFTGYGKDHHEILAPVAGGVNCWATGYEPGKNVAELGVKNGYPIILSNVDYFYLDMLPSQSPEERGLHWGGYVDEFQALSGYADELCPPGVKGKGSIIGVQGSVWGETIRSAKGLEEMMFPKLAGVAERAWSAAPTYGEADFNALLGARELPRLTELGVEWRLRQPGIRVSEGEVLLNSPYRQAEVRYTVDGTAPTEMSPLYAGPFKLTPDMKQVRAVAFMNGKRSAQTVYVQ